MFTIHDSRFILLLVGLGSAAALSAAFIAQYAFHFAPCHLCILQRWPHAAVTAIGIFGAWRIKNMRSIRLPLAACCALLFLGGGIAFYHAGVEQRWFSGPSGCTSQSTGDETLEELRGQIMNAPLVSCDQPLGDMFGIPLPMWSAAIYTFLTLLAFYGVYCTYRHDRK